MSKKENRYKIKIPVYSSELLENNKGLFLDHSYVAMVDYIDSKLAKYQDHKPKLSRKRLNKIKEIEIQNIEKIDCKIGEVPSRLIKITAYNTNMIDGFVETKEKINLTKTDKLGSETNFMLIYPRIIGLDTEKYQYQWKILLYEDPTKDNKELVSICKIVLENVFNIKICNIKLEKVLKELKNKKIISQLSIQFNSQSYDENEIDTFMKGYLVSTSLKKIKYEKFEDVPFDDVEKIINDNEYKKDYQKRILKFLFNKKEIKLTNEFIEAREKINETVEEIFNSTAIITEKETDKLFDPEFIIDKITEVLQEYLSENE